MSNFDLKTMYTASDSLASKLSACKKGYFEDEFIETMFNQRHGKHITNINRQPLINRGYYTRIKCIQDIIDSFIKFNVGLALDPSRKSIDRIQLLNLGCGFDTMSINLIRKYKSVDLKIYEIDFQDIIAEKSHILLNNSKLKKALINEQIDEYEQIKLLSTGIAINNLYLLSINLKDADEIIKQLLLIGFNQHLPTLVLTECVLVYLERVYCEKLINSLGTLLSESLWVSYDMINPYDNFGKTMKINLRNSGFNTPGFIEYPTVESQKMKFVGNNWPFCRSVTMLHAYNKLLTSDDKLRLHNLEILDEIEEWELIMSHYSFTIATNSPKFESIVNVI